MIDDFERYIKSGKAKRKTPDKEEAKALLSKAEKRMKYLRELNDETTNLVLEDAYEAAREATQSLMSLQGFKPYSHEATISFLKKYYITEFNEYQINQFDRFRELRNNSVYKAELIVIEDAKKCIDFSKEIINKIKTITHGKK
ncbi:HEPN domain-containing protein [Candidatus Woesearchaeota archaeon]|nr:HEPN domain-containing protein [Candidatus Woesearchaeota archaeon]